jgi:dolichyl-phosphate-mannose-protein mannosyltransferase
MGWGGGLLHSHVQTFPVGSMQQQVTCYHYKDENNDWIVLPRWDEPAYDPNAPLRFLKDGDVVRCDIHLHRETCTPTQSQLPSPNSTTKCLVTETIRSVTYRTTGRLRSWTISRGEQKYFEKIHSLTTRLRFRHVHLGCYLRAANAVLPQWGFKQIEVSCEKENNPEDIHTHWNVESHWNDRRQSRWIAFLSDANHFDTVPNGNAKFYRSPFLRDFWHLNVAMWTSNNALIPDPDKFDVLASAPFDWPFQHLGLRMCGWGDTQLKYYLIGTPLIWMGSTISLFIAVLLLGFYLFRQQRKYVDMEPRAAFHSPAPSLTILSVCMQANGITSSTLERLRSLGGSSISVIQPHL